MNDKLTKHIEGQTSFTLSKGKLSSKQTPLQQRIANATAKSSSIENRIMLALDCSGSMRGSSIEHLRTAVLNFISRCSNQDTSLGMLSFGIEEGEIEIGPTTFYSLLEYTIPTLHANGGTPLFNCLRKIANNHPVTRVVLISDGSPTDSNNDVIAIYKENRIPVDCVHIGNERKGEDTLKWIANETGGVYLKFSDTKSLQSGLAYLTPGCRVMLTDGSFKPQNIGASEIEKNTR